jgi:hypothetical protein
MCVAGIPSVITLIITRTITKRLNKAESKADEAQKRSDAIALGIQALLRDRLLQGYKHYQEKGWADYDDRANMENVWQQYHALGGNGDMNDLRKTFRHLPVSRGGIPVVLSEDEQN